MNLEDLVDRAILFEVDVVQFGDNRPLTALRQAARDDLADRLRTAGIGIELGMRGVAFEHIREHLAAARDLGAELLRVVIDERGAHPLSADQAIEALAPHARAFEAAGITLAIENHDSLPSAELARIVTSLGPWTGICLDTVNSFGALEGPREVLHHLGPLTVNVHVKDFDVVRAPHSMGFSIEGRAAGDGRLDLDWLMEELEDRMPLSLILELWPPPQPDLSTTRELETAWIEKSIPVLRALAQ